MEVNPSAEKKKPGPVPGIPTQKVTVLLDPDLLEWGKHQPGGLSNTLRSLLREARAASLQGTSSAAQGRQAVDRSEF